MHVLVIKVHGLNYCQIWFIFQHIEDSTKKNVLRSVQNHTLFKGKELDDLFILFKVFELVVKCTG